MRLYREIVFLPIKLINKANDEVWMRSLGYFVRLKSLFKNCTVYGFNLRKVSEMIGCSPACLSHHIKELEKRQLIRKHGNNITFIGLNKQQKLCGGTLTAPVKVDQLNQVDLLRAQII